MHKVSIRVWMLHTAFRAETHNLLANKAVRSATYDMEKEFHDVTDEWLKNVSYERHPLVKYTELKKSLN